ncbi:hypothetical protein [Lysobacter gummosus]
MRRLLPHARQYPERVDQLFEQGAAHARALMAAAAGAALTRRS